MNRLTRFFTESRNYALATFAALALGATCLVFVNGATAAEPVVAAQTHVVNGTEIQARIDQQVGQADADRQAIQVLLQRTDVRRIAGSAGIDLEQASAAAATLSGPTLESLAAQANEINGDLAGGDGTVVFTTTGIIIILLILILLT